MIHLDLIPGAFVTLRAAPLYILVGKVQSSGKDELRDRCGEKGTFYCPHPFVACELPRALGRSREARGLEMGDCMLENGLLAGWEVGVPDPRLSGKRGN